MRERSFSNNILQQANTEGLSNCNGSFGARNVVSQFKNDFGLLNPELMKIICKTRRQFRAAFGLNMKRGIARSALGIGRCVNRKVVFCNVIKTYLSFIIFDSTYPAKIQYLTILNAQAVLKLISLF